MKTIYAHKAPRTTDPIRGKAPRGFMHQNRGIRDAFIAVVKNNKIIQTGDVVKEEQTVHMDGLSGTTALTLGITTAKVFIDEVTLLKHHSSNKPTRYEKGS